MQWKIGKWRGRGRLRKIYNSGMKGKNEGQVDDNAKNKPKQVTNDTEIWHGRIREQYNI